MTDNRPVGIEWRARTAGCYSVLSVWEYPVTKIRRVLGLHRHGDGPIQGICRLVRGGRAPIVWGNPQRVIFLLQSLLAFHGYFDG